MKRIPVQSDNFLNSRQISPQNILRRFVDVLLLCCVLLLAGCSAKHEPIDPSENGIYYWKTTFTLTDGDKAFLKQHKIGKLYLRLFDVSYGSDYDGIIKAVPEATIRFKSEIPDSLEIIPVIYITQDAINLGGDFAVVIYERIKAMADAHGFSDFKEVQLDCDWTVTSRSAFFALCNKMRKFLLDDDRVLSATIRLHQLRSAAPPVDKGVLMVYNTGSIYDADTDNSIVDAEHVEPYLDSKIDYPIPLKIAFSTYGWSRVFDSENKFLCLLHTTEFNDTTMFKPIGNNRFETQEHCDIEKKPIFKGSVIISENSPISEIMAVKSLVYDNISSEIDGNIIYHLDRKSLDEYSAIEIDNILK